MEIEFLGTGTSQGIPVIACHCEVCTSTNKKDRRLRTSVHIQEGDTSIVIDTGPDFRYQMLRSGVVTLDSVLITHEHNDHLAGLDDIRPYNFSQMKRMDVHALPRVVEVIRNKYDYVFMDNPYPGAPKINLLPIAENEIQIDGIRVTCLPAFHGDMEVRGFRINSFAYITDASYIPAETMEMLYGTKVLVLNALRKEAHHSHFSLQQAIDIGRTLKVEKLYLTHISHNMGKHAKIQRELPEWVELAWDGLRLYIEN